MYFLFMVVMLGVVRGRKRREMKTSSDNVKKKKSGKDRSMNNFFYSDASETDGCCVRGSVG